ncbi:MAG: hypothetical protein DLM73_04020 [Chthoniobacterales bacterium]|nr:MAG: hypothetical protein DLM73_04020 [Chthoniobacterales bacterium]
MAKIPGHRRFLLLLAGAVALAMGAIAFGARPAISEDRELKEIDLKSWDCSDRLEGNAKTPDGAERNRLKNRSAPNFAGPIIKAMNTASFLQYVAAFEAKARNARRKDLIAPQRQQLDPLEKQIVSFEGYLVLAYAGPPETTNCASTDFHDWHLELFEKPLDHAPVIGDPTPIICEITPRTQNAIFRDNIRMQALAGFIRAPDFTIEPTGHAARRIRATGYLVWDDEHNGTADVGPTILSIGENKYHHPWRSTAWEIHPVIKIEALEGALVLPTASPSPTPPVSAASPKIIPSAAPSASSQPQFVTITQPVKIKIPYGETVLQRGTRLSVLSHDAKTVRVRYLDAIYAIPITSTDFR